MNCQHALVSLFCTIIGSYSFAGSAHSVDPAIGLFPNPLYIGAAGGYGSTTWEGLAPSAGKQNSAISLSTPTAVHEGGLAWGVLAGYELTPYFALEFNYMQYPSATLFFDEDSLFAFDSDGQTRLLTHSSMVSVMAKLMLLVPKTTVRAFSSFGVADVYRSDPLTHDWRISPSFGFGLNKNITPHIMAEIGANYTAGYGESELNPAQDFIPFLYAVFFKIAYRV